MVVSCVLAWAVKSTAERPPLNGVFRATFYRGDRFLIEHKARETIRADSRHNA